MSQVLENTECNSGQIQSSKILTLLLILTYGIALIATILCANTLPILLVLLPFILFKGYQDFRLIGVRNAPQSIVYYQQLSKDKWRLQTRAGKSIIVRPFTKVFRSKYFVIIPFQTTSVRRRILLLVAFDAIPLEQFAHLVSSLWDQD